MQMPERFHFNTSQCSRNVTTTKLKHKISSNFTSRQGESISSKQRATFHFQSLRTSLEASPLGGGEYQRSIPHPRSLITTNTHSIDTQVSRAFATKIPARSFPLPKNPEAHEGSLLSPIREDPQVSRRRRRHEKKGEEAAEARGEVAGRSITFSFPKVFRLRGELPPRGRWLGRRTFVEVGRVERGWRPCHVFLARNIFCT